FVREVIAGVILLVAFLVAMAFLPSWLPGPFTVLFLASFALVLAFAKPPLARWVEREFLGYNETVDAQEERIGSEVRAVTQPEELGPRTSEILRKELEAEWVEISASDRRHPITRIDIPGSSMHLLLGPRIGGRPYMSRELRVARTAALQFAAQHHQLSQNELRELTTRAQMRALQAQINPHFLFNTLNVLSNLIHTDSHKAKRVTEEMADIFRYALDS